MTFDSADEVIADIYEAAAVPEQWPALLGKLSAHAEGAGGILFTANPERFRWTASADIHGLFEEFIRDGWAAINPRPQRIAQLNHAGFIQDADAFTKDELDHDRVYTEFYRKRGLGWAAGTILSMPSGDSVIFSFERAYAKGPFDRATIDLFDGLRPHLARGALLSARLGLARAQAMADALSAVGLPAVILRQQGTILAANAQFQALIPSTFQDRAARLTLADKRSDRLLAEAIVRASISAVTTSVNSIPVAASDERLPMILHLLPVHGLAKDIFSQASSLLVVTPVDPAAVPSATILQALFDLTPAEARVARGVAEARSVEDIAKTLSISRETVRTQLKAVLSKTGLTRQQELVGLLAGKAVPFRGQTN